MTPAATDIAMIQKVVDQFQIIMECHGVTVKLDGPGYGYPFVTFTRGSLNFIARFKVDGVDEKGKKPFHMDYEIGYKNHKIRGFVPPEVTVTSAMVEKVLEAIKDKEARRGREQEAVALLDEATKALHACGVDVFQNKYRGCRIRPEIDGSFTVALDTLVNKSLYDFNKLINDLTERCGEEAFSKIEYRTGHFWYICLKFPRGRAQDAKDAADIIGQNIGC